MVKPDDFIMSEDGKKLLSSEIWQQIVNSLDEGMHIVDQRGRTILYNHKASELDGLEPEEVLDKNIFEVFPSLTYESSTLMQTLNNREKYNNEQQTFVNKKGQQITTINKTIPLVLSNGSKAAMEISRDITYLQEIVDNFSDLRNKIYKGKAKKSKQVKNNNTTYTFKDLIGEDESFKNLIKSGIRAAQNDSSVLIIGETGTGKELFAQGIHNASPRVDNPFIAQNCAALPRNLLESLLFGTEKGSFTGAHSKPGLFEQAEGGTILLDEINSLDYDLQAKLLRVLQEGKVRRVGGQKEIDVDVRIISTMNQNPDQAFAEGTLRQDLFYRISVVSFELPPLRERTADIPVLVDYFISKFNQEFGQDLNGISDQLLNKMKSYNWPGNVRELKHMIECGFNLCRDASCITLETLPDYLQNKLNQNNLSETNQLNRDEQLPSVRKLPSLSEYLEKVEIALIREALELADNNITKAAQELDLSRQSLQYKLKKYRIKV
ncbi:MAG: sigma-54 interaction domain-containing protein [Halarsenatibacteraceae bacterium]